MQKNTSSKDYREKLIQNILLEEEEIMRKQSQFENNFKEIFQTLFIPTETFSQLESQQALQKRVKESSKRKAQQQPPITSRPPQQNVPLKRPKGKITVREE